MTIIFFGLRTVKDSWYLVEDHTHLIGKPTFYIYANGKKHLVQAIVDASFGDIRNDNAKIIQALNSGHTLFKDNIKTINEFKNKAIFASNIHMHALTTTTFQFMEMNTNLVADIIQFK